VNAEDGGGGAQLVLPQTAEGVWSRVFTFGTEPALLTASGGDEVGLDALAAVAGKRATKAQGLIIWMGQRRQQS
jgi:hypothetical protein